MNITEAVRTQSLLAWATDPDPSPEVTAIAIVDARYLADRARRTLGAGPDADETGHQLRAVARHRATTDTDRSTAASAGHPGGHGRCADTELHEYAQVAADRLDRLAQLLTPCPRPAVEDGWDRCAHTEPWPCRITRAAWVATGQEELDLDHTRHADDHRGQDTDAPVLSVEAGGRP